MKLIIDSTIYGSQKYFHYYLIENGRLIDAKWSKPFPEDVKIEQPSFVRQNDEAVN